jgi:YegS/Rv2252/BmrU family lipid kinase
MLMWSIRFKGIKGVLRGRGCAGYGTFRPNVPATNADRRATVLVNPVARGVSRRFDGEAVVRYLARHGIAARLEVPASAEGATAAAASAAARGDHLVFAVGGDGTLRDMAMGLAGSETALAALPGGTVNIWAREAGIPRRLRDALDAHIAGQVVRMDLGRADGRCFLLMAGIGWDAEVAANVSHRLKRWTGDFAYILQALRMLPGLRTRPARWLADGEATERALAWMVLGNTRLYGGRVRLTPEATANDGQLDILAMCPRGVAETFRLAAKVALFSRREDARMVYTRAAEVVVETPGLAVQLDGDVAGETPMRFWVDRAALRVSLPAGPLPSILRSAR